MVETAETSDWKLQSMTCACSESSSQLEEPQIRCRIEGSAWVESFRGSKELPQIASC